MRTLKFSFFSHSVETIEFSTTMTSNNVIEFNKILLKATKFVEQRLTLLKKTSKILHRIKQDPKKD